MFESMYLNFNSPDCSLSLLLKRLRTSFIAAGSMRITLYNSVIEQTLHAREKQQGPSAC